MPWFMQVLVLNNAISLLLAGLNIPWQSDISEHNSIKLIFYNIGLSMVVKVQKLTKGKVNVYRSYMPHHSSILSQQIDLKSIGY